MEQFHLVTHKLIKLPWNKLSIADFKNQNGKEGQYTVCVL